MIHRSTLFKPPEPSIEPEPPITGTLDDLITMPDFTSRRTITNAEIYSLMCRGVTEYEYRLIEQVTAEGKWGREHESPLLGKMWLDRSTDILNIGLSKIQRDMAIELSPDALIRVAHAAAIAWCVSRETFIDTHSGWPAPKMSAFLDRLGLRWPETFTTPAMTPVMTQGTMQPNLLVTPVAGCQCNRVNCLSCSWKATQIATLGQFYGPRRVR